MVLFLKFLVWKWVKRKCPHVCAWCIYRFECLDEIFYEPPFDNIRKD